MGIEGLTSYIESNAHHYLTPTVVRNSKVVVDGNNFFVGKYRIVDRTCGRYGANYKKYANEVTQFFKQLQSSDIEPIVVIDGLHCMTKDNLVQHFQDQVIKAQKAKTPMMPPLIPNIFIDVAQEMGIKLIQVIGEADDTMALIAKMYDCPILSDDSDFYIYGAKFLTNYKFRRTANRSSHYSTLQGNMFNIKNLQRRFNNLDESLLPLIVVLLGNTNRRAHLDPKTMVPFFYRITRAFKCDAAKSTHKKIESTLMWLSHYTEPNKAIADILACIDKRDRAWILQVIQTQVRQFRKPSYSALQCLGVDDNVITKLIDEHNQKFKELGVNLDELEIPKLLRSERDDRPRDNRQEVENLSSESSKDHEETKQFEQFSEEELYEIIPEKLIQDHAKGYLRGYCIELRMYQAVILKVQCEYTTWKRYTEICMPIVSAMFSLMTSSMGSDENDLDIYRAHGSEVFTKKISVRKSSIKLDDIGSLALNERRAILNKALGLRPEEDLDGIPDYCKLYIANVVFWMKSDSPVKKDTTYLRAIIAAILHRVVKTKMAAKNAQTTAAPRSTRSGEQSLDEALASIMDNDCFAASAFFQKMCGKVKGENAHQATAAIVNTFGQLDVCLKYSIEFNALLRFPYAKMPVDKLVDGALFYNLFNVFEQQRHFYDFISHVFRNAPNLLNCFLIFERMVLKVIEN